MTRSPKSNFDLEKRTTDYAVRVVRLCRSVPKDSINNRITGQLAGSAGSVGANYREANDPLGKKDFLQRLRISRKEAKEAIHWLAMLREANSKEYLAEINECIRETTELKNILSNIIIKCE
jgi:four helix bundle protein